jgi:hypothetical protein
MDYESIKQALSDAKEKDTAINSFTLLREISKQVNGQDTHNNGRDLVIRALANITLFNENEKELLLSLVRNVGLFPYMSEYLDFSDIDDYLAYELHRADFLDKDIIFHSLQMNIFKHLISGHNVVLSASTSVGKSLVIDALVASDKYRKIVIVVPTIALIDETRRRLISRFTNQYELVTHPTQEASQIKSNIYILTQERVLQREDLSDVNLFIIDEFYKVDLSSKGNQDRSIDLNLAFNKLVRTGSQFYLLGPNIKSIRGLDAYQYHYIPSEFSTVAVDIEIFNLPTKGEDRNEKLLELCKTIDGPTIIYCQSPNSVAKVAEVLLRDGSLQSYDSESLKHSTDWMGEAFHEDWIVCKALKGGIGIHHGGVPRALQQHFISLFNNRKIPFLVCTSTIIEGVNTVAKNVILFDRRKNKPVIDHFTYKNIVGRAGRMNQYFIGKVYVLEEPPASTDYNVEFPIGTQDDNTPYSLLLELDKNELTDLSKKRIDDLYKKSNLSPETLRANRHVPVETQNQIALAIERELFWYGGGILSWKGIPNSDQLNAVCSFIVSYLEKDSLPDYKIFSDKQLSWHINSIRVNKDFSSYLKQCIERKDQDESYSDVIERSLKLVRNIICYRFPRALMVLDRIQRDVLTQFNLPAGDYSFFAGQVENLFMPSAYLGLDEYGVPVQTVQKIRSGLSKENSLNELLKSIYALDLETFDLSQFEKNILNDLKQQLG